MFPKYTNGNVKSLKFEYFFSLSQLELTLNIAKLQSNVVLLESMSNDSEETFDAEQIWKIDKSHLTLKHQIGTF